MKAHAVIGSNSFTGSHIVDALLCDPNNSVIGISRSPEYKDFLLPYKRQGNPNFRFHQLDLVRNFDEVIRLLDEVEPQVVDKMGSATIERAYHRQIYTSSLPSRIS